MDRLSGVVPRLWAIAGTEVAMIVESRFSMNSAIAIAKGIRRRAPMDTSGKTLKTEHMVQGDSTAGAHEDVIAEQAAGCVADDHIPIALGPARGIRQRGLAEQGFGIDQARAG